MSQSYPEYKEVLIQYNTVSQAGGIDYPHCLESTLALISFELLSFNAPYCYSVVEPPHSPSLKLINLRL